MFHSKIYRQTLDFSATIERQNPRRIRATQLSGEVNYSEVNNLLCISNKLMLILGEGAEIKIQGSGLAVKGILN